MRSLTPSLVHNQTGCYTATEAEAFGLVPFLTSSSHQPLHYSSRKTRRQPQKSARALLRTRMGEEEHAVEQTPQDAMLDSMEALLETARFDDIDDVISIASAGVSLDFKDSQGRTALHMAAANGHLDIINYLLLNGADVNASNVENNTPLHWACLNGHIEAVKHLILAGANVSALNSHERTPMDEAVSREKMDIIDAVNEAVAQVELSGTRVS